MPLPLALSIAGAASKAVGGAFGAIQGIGMLGEAKKINPLYQNYQTSEAAKAMSGLASTRLNARSQFQEQQKRAMLGSQANAMAGITRGSVDPSQSLAMAAGVQGKTNEGLAGLVGQDAQIEQQNIANYMQAQNVLVGEDRMKYQDMLTKYQLDLNQKNALRKAGANAITGGIGQVGVGLMQGAGLMQAFQDKNMGDYLSKQTIG